MSAATQGATPPADGDSEALIEAHRAYLMAVARARMSGAAAGGVTASDLVQETVVTALHAARAGTLRGEAGRWGPWMRQVLVNKIYEAFRRPAGEAIGSEPQDDAT